MAGAHGERAGGCRVTLVDGAARLLAVDFQLSVAHAAPTSDDFWRHSSDRVNAPWPVTVTASFVLPGITCRSATPIPPGEYVVKVELPSGKVLEASVVVAHGKTTELILAP